MSFLSSYNPDIRVVCEWGGYKLLVRGSPQSGSYVRMLWQRAFGRFRLDAIKDVSSILVLGIGGGTVIDLFAKLYPKASVIAVDIDEVIIGIAKRYFHVDRHTGLHIVHEDANEYVARSLRAKKAFDLVIVDLFIGPEIPSFVSSEVFLGNLRRILKPSGHVLINFLRERTYQEKSDVLYTRLSAVFTTVDDMVLYNNRFFYIST